MPSQIIWNTETVIETMKRMRQGAYVDLGCFHERNYELRAPNILFQLTQEEHEEFIKCSDDIEYFVETYCRFLTDKGRVTVPLYPSQKEILNTLGEEIWLGKIDDFGPKIRNLPSGNSRNKSCHFKKLRSY